MFGAIKGYFFGGSSTQNSSSSLKESKPLKSDVSNNNSESKSNIEKKTIIKGEKNKFDFSEEYDEDEPKQSPSTSENSSTNENKNKDKLYGDIDLNSIQNIDELDYWRMAHCVYAKDSLVNINTLNYVPFIKIKKVKEGILSYIGFGTEKSDEVKYLVGFDEHFIYMINLSKEENKNDNDTMKTIGNHYDITKISNIEIIEDESKKNKILVNILFILDNDVDNFSSKIKKFYFEKKNALKFLKLLKIYLNIYKTKITYNDKVFGNINFNQIDEIKKEKIIDTKEIIEDDKKKKKKKKKNEKEENDIKNENEKDKEEIKKEEKEEKEEKDEKDEKDDKEEKIDDKKDENNEKDEEVFTSENVVEKENKNLIDI